MPSTYIALFRGINVGGNNVLSMSELVGTLSALGADPVKTYIQSGNAVFGHRNTDVAELSSAIAAAILKSHGFRPQVTLLELPELQAAIAANPFPDGEADPKTLHLFFTASLPADPDMKMLEGIKTAGEAFKLIDKVFYLHAPNGIGRSKLAAKVEKGLGVAVTARNWRTVTKTMSLANETAA